MFKLNSHRIAYLSYFQNRNGLFWVGISIVALCSFSLILLLLDSLAHGLGLADIIMSLGFMVLSVLGFRAIRNSTSEQDAFILAKRTIQQDLSYMGLIPYRDEEEDNDFPSESYEDSGFPWMKIDTHSHGKKNNVFIRSLLITPIGGTNRLPVILGCTETNVLLFGDEIRQAEIYALHGIMEDERKAIKMLIQSNSYDKSFFESGIPLATYILLAAEYEDRVERAIQLKKLNLAPLKAYMVNKACSCPEDIKEISELPVGWVQKVNGVKFLKENIIPL